MEENQPKDLIEDFKIENVKPDDAHFKVAIVGDCRVGKTSLKEMAANKKFSMKYKETLAYTISHLSAKINNFQLSIELWDTSGDEQYKKLFEYYFKKTTIVILVYDVANRESFENLDNWINIINNYPKVKNVILVGNKSDIKDKRQVSKVEGENYIISREIIKTFFECSAINYKSVETIFKETIKQLYEIYTENEHKKKKDENSKGDNTKCCGCFRCC